MALETDFSQFWLQLGGIQRGPLEAQFLTFLALKLVLAPQPPQDPPTGLLGPSKKPLGTDFGGHFERFFDGFGSQLV